MKRVLIAMLLSLPLALGASAAQADEPTHGTTPSATHGYVAGTIVSVDTSAGSFVANATVVHPHSGDESDGGTPLSKVTITTDSNTKVMVDGKEATVSDLSAGQKFAAAFNGSPSDTLDNLVSNPAVEVVAESTGDSENPTPTKPKGHQLYAFVGTVTAVDTSAGTVTVDVLRSLPGDLVPSGSSSATFTVGPHTVILGGGSSSSSGDPVAHAARHDDGIGGLTKGSLSNVSVGDVVAGAEVGPAGETLDQVEAAPLAVLLDLPAPASSSTSSGAGTTTTTTTTSVQVGKALKQALALLSHHSAKKHKKVKHHKTRKHHSHK